MKRYGAVVSVKPGKVDCYKELHAAAWPEVLEIIRRSHVRNHSI